MNFKHACRGRRLRRPEKANGGTKAPPYRHDGGQYQAVGANGVRPQKQTLAARGVPRNERSRALGVPSKAPPYEHDCKLQQACRDRRPRRSEKTNGRRDASPTGMIVTYTTPVPCEILRSATPTPQGVILERSEESGVACSRMTTQGEHGENPHQAVGVGALDDPKKQA